MNKKIITIVAIMALVVVALVAAVAMRNNESVSEGQKATKTSQPADKTENKTTAAAQPTGDADVDAINKDLDSVSDEDFSDNFLSDTSVGL
ncbi:MAG: hypothetical protein WC238_04845 [Parcubacteria group bacterium]|jgi:ABC-type oligopeptide transport system substrate-binding subunit